MVNANEKEPRSIRLQGLSECQRKEAERKQAKEWQQKQWGREETGRVRKQTYTPSTAAFTANEPRKRNLHCILDTGYMGIILKKVYILFVFLEVKTNALWVVAKNAWRNKKKYNFHLDLCLISSTVQKRPTVTSRVGRC